MKGWLAFFIRAKFIFINIAVKTLVRISIGFIAFHDIYILQMIITIIINIYTIHIKVKYLRLSVILIT